MNKVNRLEVIDHTSKGEGRAYIKRGDINVEIEYQDAGQTIKIFITDGKSYPDNREQNNIPEFTNRK